MAETLQERLRSATGDVHQTMWEAADALDAKDAEIARLTAERDEARQDVIAFCAVWAVQYAKANGHPDGHLYPTHYDILKQAGARMADFTRAEVEDEPCAPI